MYIPYVLTGEWRLGRGLCKLWLVVDYMLCTASVFNIVLISFDRFQSVTKAVSEARQHANCCHNIETVTEEAQSLENVKALQYQK